MSLLNLEKYIFLLHTGRTEGHSLHLPEEAQRNMGIFAPCHLSKNTVIALGSCQCHGEWKTTAEELQLEKIIFDAKRQF